MTGCCLAWRASSRAILTCNVLRDPVQNVLIHNPQERWGRLGHNSNIDELARYGSKLKDDIAASLKSTANQGALTA